MTRVVLLGGTGFFGKNLQKYLESDFEVFVANRTHEKNSSRTFYFDFLEESSWENLLSLKPDLIINSSGYGVVKDQMDLNLMYQINYLKPVRLLKKCVIKNPDIYWIQIGSGFEYDLTEISLKENSPCIPTTHYGISKYMMSHFLIESISDINYVLFRPFAMYGNHESNSKIIPYLILAQKNKISIPLSDGSQKRDYIYVNDAAIFVVNLLKNYKKSNKEIINLGTGEPLSIKFIAEQIAPMLPDYDPDLWKWGQLSQRDNENFKFYNASLKANNLGLTLSPRSSSLRNTIDFYYQN